jgi:hypothetical protein
VLVALALFWLASNHRAAVAHPSNGPHCGEYWIVNTREVPTCDDLAVGFERLIYTKFDAARGWLRASREEFVAAMDPSVPTTFFVHGSFLKHKGAIEAGWQFYRQIDGAVGPFRLVVWSWPAERIRHMNAVDNFRVKAVRSEKQGYYLAALIERLDPDLQLQLISQSLGGRTVCAALEGLATGEAAGETLPSRAFTPQRHIRAGLLVPSFDPRYLWIGGRYGNALSQVDLMLIAYNPRDRLMRAYTRRISPRVLGQYGIIDPARLGENEPKLVQVNSASWVGRAHRLSRYSKSDATLAWLRRYVFPPAGGAVR